MIEFAMPETVAVFFGWDGHDANPETADRYPLAAYVAYHRSPRVVTRGRGTSVTMVLSPEDAREFAEHLRDWLYMDIDWTDSPGDRVALRTTIRRITTALEKE